MPLVHPSIEAASQRQSFSSCCAVKMVPLLKTRCSTCNLRGLCPPCCSQPVDVTGLDDFHFNRTKVKAGKALYHQGQAFRNIYAVRVGTFKSSLTLVDGREQVTGFQMAGDLMGWDGIANGTYASNTTALEDAEVCAIPYDQRNGPDANSADLQQAISRLMSWEIVREHSLMMMLGSMNAEERLAAFLLDLSQRLKLRGYSAGEFSLRMSRAEIGSYLGMQLETVSRTFSAFQQLGILVVDKRHIRIGDAAALKRVVGARVH